MSEANSMSDANIVKHDVFISYSSKNKNVADAVVADFEQNGIKQDGAKLVLRDRTNMLGALRSVKEVA